MLFTVLVAAMTDSVALESRADEEVFGYVKGADPLPKGELEVVQRVTVRSDKGVDHYCAWEKSSSQDRLQLLRKACRHTMTG